MTNKVQDNTPKTVAEEIWNEIKDKEIHMFALPNQRISDYCQPFPIEPSRCFLFFKASAVLPALETAIGKNYECEAVDKYIVVKRKTNAV